jgi:hypothetical protein
MSDTPNEPQAYFHLLLDRDEVPVTASALRLLISDEAHQPQIRGFAREVLAALEDPADEFGVTTVTLSPAQMKITHTAVRLLFNDMQRGQSDERETLRAILEKLPDEHTMRAIILD